MVGYNEDETEIALPPTLLQDRLLNLVEVHPIFHPVAETEIELRADREIKATPVWEPVTKELAEDQRQTLAHPDHPVVVPFAMARRTTPCDSSPQSRPTSSIRPALAAVCQAKSSEEINHSP